MEHQPKVKLCRNFYRVKSTAYMSNRFQDIELSDICKKIIDSDFDINYVGYKDRELIQFNEKNNKNTLFTISFKSGSNFKIKLKYIKGTETCEGIRHPFYIIGGVMSLDNKIDEGKYSTGEIKDQSKINFIRKKKRNAIIYSKNYRRLQGLALSCFNLRNNPVSS